MEEHLAVNQVGAGSRPVPHPKTKGERRQEQSEKRRGHIVHNSYPRALRAVAFKHQKEDK